MKIGVLTKRKLTLVSYFELFSDSQIKSLFRRRPCTYAD
jgi:hypothetical protein